MLRIQRRHVVIIQREIKNVKVVTNTGRIDRLWDHSHTALQLKSDGDLGGRFVVFFRYFKYIWIFEQHGVVVLAPWPRVGPQGAVCRHDNVIFFCKMNQILLWQVRVALNLKHRRGDLCG